MRIVNFMNSNFSPEVMRLKAATLNPNDNESPTATVFSTPHPKV